MSILNFDERLNSIKEKIDCGFCIIAQYELDDLELPSIHYIQRVRALQNYLKDAYLKNIQYLTNYALFKFYKDKDPQATEITLNLVKLYCDQVGIELPSELHAIAPLFKKHDELIF